MVKSYYHVNIVSGMAFFLKNTTFHGILLDALFDAGSENEDKREVVRLVTEGIKSGAVRPLPATVFSESQVRIHKNNLYCDLLF